MCRLALVQLAVRNGIFLLDMLALSDRLFADDWRHFLEQVLCNVEIQVVGECFVCILAVLVFNNIWTINSWPCN